MSQKIQAIVFKGPGEIAMGQFELGPCGPTDIVVRTLYTMVSTGTELRVLAGHYGAAENFPLIPGYAVIGEVTAVGKDVKGYRVGDLISGRNPHPVPGIKSQWGGQASQHVYVTTGENRPVVLPSGAKPLDYVIAEVSAISYRGVQAAEPKPGETAVVLGQGVIGAFSAAWLHARGCRVIVADLEPGRLERALAWGASAAVNIAEGNATERILSLCDGGADIVVESSGTSAGARLACQLVRRKPQAFTGDYRVEPISFYSGQWSRLVFQANYLEEIPINPFGFFAGEGLTILTPADHGIEDRQSAVEELRRGVIRASDFVQRVVPFADALLAYPALRDDKNNNFSLVFDWTKA
ncbi:MAG: zinc-binding dehydrogenase [Terrimicrobiaceae bacterium]|jgi:2-desacetyl-2-hydroxyethyl bacteriochlorophyllide A dehydrogenase